MIDNTIRPLIAFTGNGAAGFFMGMFLRRVTKFLVIIIGSFFGAVFLVIQWMQARQYIQGQVDGSRVGNEISSFRSAYIWHIGNSRNYWSSSRNASRPSRIVRDNMKFLHLHLFHKEVEFGNIGGYDDIKDIVRRALDAEDNYNLLFIGPPASAKTLFLIGIP